MSIIRKAVFPVAGMGTRFLPDTRAGSMEMSLVVEKPQPAKVPSTRAVVGHGVAAHLSSLRR